VIKRDRTIVASGTMNCSTRQVHSEFAVAVLFGAWAGRKAVGKFL
jgi:hypothetical protein